jgi:hypothetical protein
MSEHCGERDCPWCGPLPDMRRLVPISGDEIAEFPFPSHKTMAAIAARYGRARPIGEHRS